MKKLIALLLALTLVCCLFACGKKEKKSESAYTIADKVITDTDDVKLTVVKAYADASYVNLTVKAENKSGKAIHISFEDDQLVNGYAGALILQDYVNLAVGETKESDVEIDSSFLRELGTPNVEEFSCTLRVYEEGCGYDDADMVHETVTVYPTGLTSYEAPARPSGKNEVALVDNDKVTFTYLKGANDEYGLFYEMTVLVENKTAEPMTFVIDGLTVNGEDSFEYQAANVPAGKSALVVLTSATADDSASIAISASFYSANVAWPAEEDYYANGSYTVR